MQKILTVIFCLGTFVFSVSIPVVAQNKIAYAEYYVDNDPGFRKANSIAITPSTQISNITVSINPDTLQTGIHNLIVRAVNEDGIWSLDMIWPFLKPFNNTDTAAAKPAIVYIEYYVNTDPGQGNAQSLSFTSGSNINNLLISVDTATADFHTGINTIGVRAKDALGNWSLIYNWLFLKPFKSSDTLAVRPDINYIEYFVNTDPGLGNAENLSFTQGADISNLVISLDTATAGFHAGINTIGVRAKDAKGNWSLVQSWLFVRPFESIDTVIARPNIMLAEYYLDTDPGYGKATSIQLTPGIDIKDLLISLDTALISSGLHNLMVRTRDSTGKWSLTSSWLFYKPVVINSGTDTIPNISYIEYFSGSADPGFGNAVGIPFTPGTDLNNLFISLDTADMETGINRVTVRGRDAKGNWSLNQVYLFYRYPTDKDTISPLSNIVYLEYYIDNDPGLGQGTPVTITPSTDINNLDIPLNILGWEVGNYNFYLRGLDSLGNWSLINTWSFKIEVPSGYIITVGQINDTVCAGQSVSVPFAVNSAFGSTNVFTAQLSNAAGSFANPVNIGSLSGSISDTINATIPSNLAIGDNYQIRVIASTPFDTSINISPVVVRRIPLSLAIYYYDDTIICKGSHNYYGYPTEGGNVNYSWSISGGGSLSTSEATASVNWTMEGMHTVKLSSFNYCGIKTDSLNIEIIDTPLTGSISNMLPADSNRNLSFPITFSWFPIENASSYDLYIWPSDQVRPSSPFAGNITSINYILYGGLQYEKYYKWQIVAKRACYTLESTVQTFQLRYLSDLIVNNIQVPSSGFSGQNISVSWEIKNAGQGSTLNQQWFDLVYLSHDAILDNTDVLLGSVQNQSELAAGASYLQTSAFRLPQGINDNYYIFIKTNPYNQVQENDISNNTGASTASIFVQLTPPPDLQVTSILAPNFTFSGEEMAVTYKVANMGTGGTVFSSWTDNIYLSPDSVLNFANARFMGNYTRNGVLNEGENYTRTQNIQLPVGIFGKHYIYVLTDVYQQIYEHASENNNTGRSDTFNILLTPPIDLAVNEITIPASGSNGDKVTINWKVENAGGSSASGKYWTDKIYLSKASTFKRDSILLVGSVFRNDLLTPGDIYAAQTTVNIPGNITGNYYVYVRTDADSIVFEHTFESNNIKRSAAPLLIMSPDLVVSSVNIPLKDSSGKNMEVAYGIRNNGPGLLVDAAITDRILLSTSATFNASNIIVLKTISYSTGNIASGDTLAKSTTVTLPDGLAGVYYIYIQTDFSNVVFENVNENNNVRRSTSSLNIILSPWPDLHVFDIQMPDSVTASDVISMSFKVTNEGEKETADTLWSDKIYFSLNSTFDSASSVFIREIIHSQPLAKDSAYVVNASVKVPGNIAEGNYYVYVFSDSKNEVYEHIDEADNISRKGFIYIKKYPPVDLAVTAVSAPLIGNSGQSISITYAVENKGVVPTLQGQWYDGVYLSADTVWDKNTDLFVTAFLHTGELQPGNAYSGTHNVVLPDGISGQYYLLFVTDHDDVNNDENRLNNYRLIKSGNNNVPISIALTPPSDLIVTLLKVPDNGTAGQPIRINWKVKNRGTGATGAKIWTEKIYLSNNLTIDGNDQVLGSFTRNDSLSPNDEYADSLQVFLPNYASGNYVIIFKADANNNVYEHQNENNNTSYSLITIVKPPLSDIIVTDVVVPANEIMAGEAALIEWKVKNIGANPATGYMKQAIYLSLDTIKDVSDVLLASLDDYINLAPADEISKNLTKEINGVSLKEYYAIIHTDILNNIIESNDTNNVSFSGQKLKISVPELVINVPATRSLSNSQEVYYRIEIPDSLRGESLLITLKGDSADGSNEMYVRFGEVPNRVTYDYVHSQPYESSQEIIVPDLVPGTYYLMVTGNTTASLTQQIDVLARILPFEIRSVNAVRGGNTGRVTIQVNGSKLANVNAIRLTRGISIYADSIVIVNPTLMYATFNLNGVQTGKYDVAAENNNGGTAILPQGFEVVTGTVSNLVSNVITPPSTRPSNVIGLSVQYTNAGNTDLVNPVLKLTSFGGAPIAFTVSDLVNNITELIINAKEVNGPVGILRPGASGTVIIYAKATSALMFSLTQPK